MHLTRQSFTNAIALGSFFSIGACLIPAIAHANPQSIKQPLVISRLLPKTTAFDCGGAAITLTREPVNHDRFTYEAVTARGQTLRIPNGVGYGDSTSTIYTFVAKDGSEYIVEQRPDGSASLTTSSSSTSKPTTFDCTVIKSSAASSGSAASSSSSMSTSESSSSVSVTRTTVTRTTVAKPVPQPVSQPSNGAVRALW